MEALAGVTSIVTSTTGGGAITSRLAGLLVMPSSEAVMSVVPPRSPLARPLLSMDATPGRELFQLADVVTSCELPSL